MIKKYTSQLSIVFILFFHISAVFAQKEELKNSYISNPIKTDGLLNEWNDSLQYYNNETKLAYTIGNDENNLYVALKISDPQEIQKILSFGISFSVNKEGKKKAGPTITFPITDKAAIRMLTPNQDPNKLNQQILSKTIGIYVNDYKTILDGIISLKNEYGIFAGATIDEKNSLRYELTIPLKQLDIDLQSQGLLYYNIKLNGPRRSEVPLGPPMRNPGGSGYGYPDQGNRGFYKRNVAESINFWIKASLAKS